MPKRKSSTLADQAPLTTVPIPLPAFGDEPPLKRRASGRNPSNAKLESSMSTDPSINAHDQAPITIVPVPPPAIGDEPALKRRASGRKPSRAKPDTSMSTNPNINANVLDAPGPLRASPDGSESDDQMDLEQAGMDVKNQVKTEDVDEDVPSLTNGADSDSSLSDMPDVESPVKAKAKVPARGGKGKAAAENKTNGVSAEKTAPQPSKDGSGKKESSKESQFLDPDADGMEEADEEEIQAALSRPPPVNTNYLPLPWKGRIGYVSGTDPC